MNDEGFWIGILIASCVSVSLLVGLGASSTGKEHGRQEVYQQAIERGYMYHHPQTGERVWVEPEKRGGEDG